MLLQEPQIMLFAIGFFYVPSGPIEWILRRATGRQLEKLPAQVAPEAPQESSA